MGSPYEDPHYGALAAQLGHIRDKQPLLYESIQHQQHSESGWHYPTTGLSPIDHAGGMSSVPKLGPAGDSVRRMVAADPHQILAIAETPQYYDLYGYRLPSFIVDGVEYATLVPQAVYIYSTSVIASRNDPNVSAFRRDIFEHAGGYTHIEFAFRFSAHDVRGPRDQILSCSSQVGKEVVFLDRDITNKAYNPVEGKWESAELQLTHTQRQLAWVYSQAQVGKPYNIWGVRAFASELRRTKTWLCWLRCMLTCCCASVYDNSSMFCSQLVVKTLEFMFYNDPARLRAIQAKPAHLVTTGEALALINSLNIVSSVVDTPIDAAELLQAFDRREEEKDAARSKTR
jgi:hypothetical protein